MLTAADELASSQLGVLPVSLHDADATLAPAFLSLDSHPHFIGLRSKWPNSDLGLPAQQLHATTLDHGMLQAPPTVPVWN